MRYVVYYHYTFGRARYRDNLTLEEAIKARDYLLRRGYFTIEIEPWS